MTATITSAPRATPPASAPAGRRPRRTLGTGLWALALGVGLIASIVLCVSLGPADISPWDAWRSILARTGWTASPLTELRDGIVWELRMPRVLAAAAVGAGLGLCGTIMQAVLRNPLADPYLLGLSSGASVGAVVVIVLGVTVALPAAAFAGAVVGTLSVSRVMVRP